MDITSIIKFAKTFYKLSQAKPKLYFLIGPPAVGKSTWIQSNASGAEVCNRDDQVVEAALESGVGTYDDMFARPEIKLEIPVPSKETFLMAGEGDNIANNEINDFLNHIKILAKEFNQKLSKEIIQKLGQVVPFGFNQLKQIIVNYGVPSKFVVPFEYENVSKANNLVGSKFDSVRTGAVNSGNDIIIDMTNMNVSSRDSHRKFIVAAKEGISFGKADPKKVNDYYDQVAIVFANGNSYSEFEMNSLKEVAKNRAEEIKASGGSKTIPDSAYDRMFQSFEPPQEAEGFFEIKFVGIPSLNSLKEV